MAKEAVPYQQVLHYSRAIRTSDAQYALSGSFCGGDLGRPPFYRLQAISQQATNVKVRQQSLPEEWAIKDWLGRWSLLGITDLLQGVGVAMTHVLPSKSRGPDVQDVCMAGHFGLKIVPQVAVLWRPGKLINVQVDDPVRQVLVLLEAFSARIDPSQTGVIMPDICLIADVIPAMLLV